MKSNCDKNVKIFLIGNKLDLEEERLVPKEKALQFQKDHKFDFFIETSAKTGMNVQEIFVEAAKILYEDFIKNKKECKIPEYIKLEKEEKHKREIKNKEEEEKIISNLEDKFQIVAFSTNDIDITPNDIINIFLSQKEHEILKKSRFSIAFKTNLNNLLTRKIMICSVLNLTKEYIGINDVNCYLVFIDLEKEDSIKKLEVIVSYAKDYCATNKLFFVIGIISGEEYKEVKEINKADITKILEDANFKYNYIKINLSNQKEIYDMFLEIFDFCCNNPINKDYEIEDKLSNSINSLDISLIADKLPYDIILSFNRFKDIKQGWDLQFSEKGLKYFDIPIKCQKIGILGNRQTGRSFILSKFFGLPEIKTPLNSKRRISIKLKESKNKISYMVFDSQGFDIPILDDNNSDEKNKTQDKIIDIKEIKEKENNNKSDFSKNYLNMEFDEEINKLKKRQLFEELKVDRKLSEEFIKRFIIEYSDMIIIIVGTLKYYDQIMLKNIMEECIKYKKKTLFVIHNQIFNKSKSELDIYIKDIMMNSFIFNLEEMEEIQIGDHSNSNDNSDDKEETPIYYTSSYKSMLTVYHLFLINDNCKDKSYNEITKKRIESYLNLCPPTKFNMYESFEKKVKEILNEYSNDKKIKIDINKIDELKGRIIYKGNGELIFKKTPNNISEIELKYSYYITGKGKEEKLIILIERPGDIKDINIVPKKYNTKYIIQYKGKKYPSEEEKKYEENMINEGRDFGEFILDINIYLKDYEISNLEEPKYYDKNGIQYIEYNLLKIENCEE